MAAAVLDADFRRSPLALYRGAVAIAAFLILWEVAARMHGWTGYRPPGIGNLPAPTAVLQAWTTVVADVGYWQSWAFSFARVLGGFFAALLLGVPFGLFLAMSRTFHDFAFPVFEVIRPIPPLAWVPAAIIFWPTQELAIMFITFLGAFFTITINVLGGARAIDTRFVRAAVALGASKALVFRRIVLPAIIPAIVVGSTVGMGITWEVVVAAEMISGTSKLSSTSGGLGHFIWSSYIGGAYEQIIVGMVSIGIAGYLCSAGVRMIGAAATPWLRQR
jgi:NitT/TauT family transport system permease protein